MGQAKQRGTFEQRRAEGIAKRLQEERTEQVVRKIRSERHSKSHMSVLLAASLMAATTLKDL